MFFFSISMVRGPVKKFIIWVVLFLLKLCCRSENSEHDDEEERVVEANRCSGDPQTPKVSVFRTICSDKKESVNLWESVCICVRKKEKVKERWERKSEQKVNEPQSNSRNILCPNLEVVLGSNNYSFEQRTPALSYYVLWIKKSLSQSTPNSFERSHSNETHTH